MINLNAIISESLENVSLQEIFNTLPKENMDWIKGKDEYHRWFGAPNNQTYLISLKKERDIESGLYDILQKTDEDYSYFNLPEEYEIGMDIYRDLMSGKISAWELEFKNESTDIKVSSKTGLTKTGSSASVFSIIINLVREFLEKNPQIKLIYFIALEDSRQKLYSSILKKIVSGSSEWTYLDGFLNGNGFYVITR